MSGFGPEPSVSSGVATDVRRRARLDTGRLGAYRNIGLPGAPGAAGSPAPTQGPARGKNAASIRAAAAAAAAHQDALDKAAEQANRTVDGHIETLVEGMGALVQLTSVGDKAEHLIQEDNLAMAARADAMVRAATSLVSLSRGLSVSLCLAPPPQPPTQIPTGAQPQQASSAAASSSTSPTIPGTENTGSATPIPSGLGTASATTPGSAPGTAPGTATGTPAASSPAATSSEPLPPQPVGPRAQAQLDERVKLLLSLTAARREAAGYIDVLSRAAAHLPTSAPPASAEGPLPETISGPSPEQDQMDVDSTSQDGRGDTELNGTHVGSDGTDGTQNDL